MKMKIALLNLPFDANYGGNLQRYALVSFLQKAGYEIEHINLRFNYQLPWYKLPFSYIWRILQKITIDNKKHIFVEKHLKEEANRKNKNAELFYNKYIPHTHIITKKNDLYKLPHYDAYIVGSDQVWRKAMTKQYGLSTYFFDFVKEGNIKIAYGVSLGSDKNELTSKEIENLGKLYKQFKTTSVREDSALQLFKSYQWTSPQAIQVIDPTFLLTKNEYIKLIDSGSTKPCPGELFCYILDNTLQKDNIIQHLASEKQLEVFKTKLDGSVSIEQWLRSFKDAQHIVTDSYHGLIFSIIFNKPFTLIRNEKRGNARFDSLLTLFDIKINSNSIDWNKINLKIDEEREKAMKFIQKALNSKNA